MEAVRRALEIAATGGHDLLMSGPPRAGKSMLAARLPGLLPDLTPPEALEVSMIRSVAGMLNEGAVPGAGSFGEPGSYRRRRQPGEAGRDFARGSRRVVHGRNARISPRGPRSVGAAIGIGPDHGGAGGGAYH